MKTHRSNRKSHGLTLFETLVVVALLVFLIALLLPPMEWVHRPHHYANCMNNLKQDGLAFRIWEGDNNDKYPMAVSVTNGGAMEFDLTGNPLWVFQVMSNELSTPKILTCPEDGDHECATNFGPALTAKNLSYFVKVDATEASPQDIMSGDDNFVIGGTSVKAGPLLLVTSNTPIAWFAARHKFSGNLLMADGSVFEMNHFMLTNWLRLTNSTAMRLALP